MELDQEAVLAAREAVELWLGPGTVGRMIARLQLASLNDALRHRMVG